MRVAIQDGPLSSAEERLVIRRQGDSDCSTAVGSVMVSGVDGSGTGRSNPAVHRGSRSADSRRFDRRRGDGNSSLPAIKSTRVETLRAILRAKDHSREAAHMMSRSLRESSLQVYESHWARFVAFCRSKRWHMFRVRSHHGLTASPASQPHTAAPPKARVWLSARPPAAGKRASLVTPGYLGSCSVSSPEWCWIVVADLVHL